MDQAANLRKLVLENKPLKKTKTVAITSGKGGVGQSSLAVSLSIALARLGSSVTAAWASARLLPVGYMACIG